MRVGLLFGTFDPPHAGHVAIAEHMKRTQGLDAVWLMVTPRSPFKQGATVTAEHHRLAMTRLAVAGHAGIEACDIEMELPQPNYTADTLRLMRLRWPGWTFSLILGSDNLAGLHRWKEPDAILEDHEVLVYPRPGYEEQLASNPYRHHPKVMFVRDAPLFGVSSTRIREDLRAGRSIGDLVDPRVQEYAAVNGLYSP